MKIIVIVLLFCAAMGLLGGITGVKRYRYSSGSGTEVTRYDPVGQAGVFIFGLTSLAAALGCWKRKKFGWYLTMALIAAGIAITLWGIIMILAASWANIPTALWWTAQTVAMCYLVRWWLRQLQQFEATRAPNSEHSDSP